MIHWLTLNDFTGPYVQYSRNTLTVSQIDRAYTTYIWLSRVVVMHILKIHRRSEYTVVYLLVVYEDMPWDLNCFRIL